MTRTAPVAPVRYAEYLVAEQTSQVRHEYLNGAVFAMVVHPSTRHSLWQ